MVADIDPHVISITESWANKDIVDAELALTGYVMFRKYRPEHRTRGRCKITKGDKGGEQGGMCYNG